MSRPVTENASRQDHGALDEDWLVIESDKGGDGHRHDLTCFLMVSVLHSLNLTPPYHRFGAITFPRIGIIIPSEDKGRHIGYAPVSHHIEEEGEDTKLSPDDPTARVTRESITIGDGEGCNRSDC